MEHIETHPIGLCNVCPSELLVSLLFDENAELAEKNVFNFLSYDNEYTILRIWDPSGFELVGIWVGNGR